MGNKQRNIPLQIHCKLFILIYVGQQGKKNLSVSNTSCCSLMTIQEWHGCVFSTRKQKHSIVLGYSSSISSYTISSSGFSYIDSSSKFYFPYLLSFVVWQELFPWILGYIVEFPYEHSLVLIFGDKRRPFIIFLNGLDQRV